MIWNGVHSIKNMRFPLLIALSVAIIGIVFESTTNNCGWTILLIQSGLI